jgi:hypothetical protein
MTKPTFLLAAMLSAVVNAQAQQTPSNEPWQFGAVLDVTSISRTLELGTRDQGLQLGHSDLTASGPLGRHLQAQITAVLATHEGKLEKSIEEAWVETRTLPLGLSARAGRFASQIGYLNQQHPHADDFVERPLLYRAFLGGHWNDDGLRLNLTLPTGLYWMVGAEAFRGHKLVAHADPAVSGAGAFTVATKIGGDLNRSNSWQVGMSYLKNRRIAVLKKEYDEEVDDHDHDHAARFGGKHMWLIDGTWKWAPDGNNRNQQARLTVQAARVNDINRFATSGQKHEALSLSAVWRFKPAWEVGARFDRLRVAIPHDDHFHAGRLNEQALMLAWKPSHMQSLRLQFSRQNGAVGFENPARRSVALQYILAFGAHGAHAY